MDKFYFKGKRLALVEMKLVICHLLHNFSLETCNKTVNPMSYSSGNVMSPRMPLGEVWLTLLPRN